MQLIHIRPLCALCSPAIALIVVVDPPPSESVYQPQQGKIQRQKRIELPYLLWSHKPRWLLLGHFRLRSLMHRYPSRVCLLLLRRLDFRPLLFRKYSQSNGELYN